MLIKSKSIFRFVKTVLLQPIQKNKNLSFTNNNNPLTFRLQYHFAHSQDKEKLLQQFQAIKKKQRSSTHYKTDKQASNSNQQAASNSNKQAASNSNKQAASNYKCDGCNADLQFTDKKKYGYINQENFRNNISQNKKVIFQTYGERINSQDQKMMNILHDIQKQTKVQIFQQGEQKLSNLDNLQVLMALQDKIDSFQQSNQTLKRTKKLRKQIFCYRCHSLKYHNRLPEEYDSADFHQQRVQQIDKQAILKKVFNKHKGYDTYFFLLIDSFDICGTFKEQLLHRLLRQKVKFCIVVNKYDVINVKYLNQTLINAHVKATLKKYIKSYYQNNEESQVNIQERIKEIKVMFVSSISREGIKKLQKFISQGITRIQLLGLPNTGKTTLLNKLARISKITSKIPGTTIRISQHQYKKFKYYDMPGLNYHDLLYNLIARPSLKSILTWSKEYSPPLMTHSCFFFGGKIQAQGLRIVLFGLGGACSSDNQWFILNYKQFWKGLPPLNQLKMKRYEHKIALQDDIQSQDLQIAGYGFINFRKADKESKKKQYTIVFYLPQGITFNFRPSVVRNQKILHFRSALTKRHMLQRIKKVPSVI